MTLSPRAIALQGFGFGIALVAVQGFGLSQPLNFGGGGTWHTPRNTVGSRIQRVTSTDNTRELFINNQNRTIIALVMGFAAEGAFE